MLDALEVVRSLRAPGVPAAAPERAADGAIFGGSPAMLEVYKAIGRVAAQDVTVLLTGESGTGKELVALAIHRHSARARAPFLALNCAAIPQDLLESELFGHEKGAFTGADRRRVGRFEQCSGGTLLLDENDARQAPRARHLGATFDRARRRTPISAAPALIDRVDTILVLRSGPRRAGRHVTTSSASSACTSLGPARAAHFRVRVARN